MKEHYYVIKWSKAEGWEIDTDTEEARFPDGTVWNGQEWELPYSYGYDGEGLFNDGNDLITERLGLILSQANEKEDASA